MALKFKNEAINKQKSKFTKSKKGKYFTIVILQRAYENGLKTHL